MIGIVTVSDSDRDNDISDSDSGSDTNDEILSRKMSRSIVSDPVTPLLLIKSTHKRVYKTVTVGEIVLCRGSFSSQFHANIIA